MLRRPIRDNDFPLNLEFLNRYRIEAGRRAKSTGVGGHRRYRQGQSLEFREHTAYRFGDDFRHIDWRASARRGGGMRDLIVRRFHTEERFTLAISVDNRDTMYLPENVPKIRIARWLALALAAVAALAGDRVILHRLFGEPGGLLDADGRAALGAARRFVAQLDRPVPPRSNQPAILPRLRPTTVWVIMTDLYFDDPFNELAHTMVRAQDGLCWVVLVNLDSWPAERAILMDAPVLIEGPFDKPPWPMPRVELTQRNVGAVEGEIHKHCEGFIRSAERGGLSVTPWSWEVNADAAAFFRKRFCDDQTLRRIFRPEP